MKSARARWGEKRVFMGATPLDPAESPARRSGGTSPSADAGGGLIRYDEVRKTVARRWPMPGRHVSYMLTNPPCHI